MKSDPATKIYLREIEKKFIHELLHHARIENQTIDDHNKQYKLEEVPHRDVIDSVYACTNFALHPEREEISESLISLTRKSRGDLYSEITLKSCLVCASVIQNNSWFKLAPYKVKKVSQVEKNICESYLEF